MRKRNRASDIPKTPTTRFTKVQEFVKQDGTAELVADCLRLLGIPACFMKHPVLSNTEVVIVEGDGWKSLDMHAIQTLCFAIRVGLDAPLVSNYIQKSLLQGGYIED